MAPPPSDLDDWLERESDSELSGSESEEEDSEGSISQGAADEDREDKSDSRDKDANDDLKGHDDVEDYMPAKGITVPPLLPIPASIKKPNQSLCRVCQKLKLSPRKFLIMPGDPENTDDTVYSSIGLGNLEHIKQKSSHCPLCRLILAALGPETQEVGKNGKKATVDMVWDTDLLPEGQHCVRIIKPIAETVLTPKGITLLANDAPPGKRTQLVRVVGDQIDWEMVRNWLNMCRNLHGSVCDRSKMSEHEIKDPAKEIPHFRLIDVVNNCIIPAPHGVKYVALSYTWGGIDPTKVLRSLMSNYKDLERPGALLCQENYSRIPITIQDAIQVVRELRLGYLWVDSLCIIQDDTAPGGSKMSSISGMGLVYGAAYLTIWAATGNGANAGLPGVRPNTRGWVQPIEEVLPDMRLGYRSHLPYTPEESANAFYFTRAWTFQEQQFTSRSLQFFGGRVVYCCSKAGAWTEDILFEDNQPEETEREECDGSDLSSVQGLIGQYSKLNLTMDSDIYHAFAGLNDYFQTRLRFKSVHGIPNVIFDWALLFDPSNICQRRDKTPSWSWSGWIGGSQLHFFDHCGHGNNEVVECRKALRSRTWIIWYHRKAHDSEEVVRIWTPEKSLKPTSQPRNFYGSHVKERFLIDCSQTIPTPRKLVGAPQYIEDSLNPTPGSGFLQFWTVSLEFKVDKSRSKGVWWLHDEHTRFGIYGRSNRELGVVHLHPDWAKANLGKNQEFIILCEGQEDRGGGVDEWTYKVMLIEWKGDWAERVSVGSIRKKHLKESAYGPQWKEIILG